MLWPHSVHDLDEFYKHLNNQNPSKEFTIEHERDNDVMIAKDGQNVKTSIDRNRQVHQLFITPATQEFLQEPSNGYNTALAERICDKEHLHISHSCFTLC